MASLLFNMAGLVFCAAGFIASLNHQPVVPWIPIGLMFVVIANTIMRRR